MRRARLLSSVALLALAPLLDVGAQARRPAAEEASLFLLLPVGARGASLANATSTMQRSSDAVWANPAGIASIQRLDGSLNHGQSVIGRTDALAIAVRSPFGVTAFSANILDYGEALATDIDTVAAGTLYARNVAVGLSQAVSLGSSVRIGATYRLAQFRFDCSGECPDLPAVLASTSAFDVGVQYSAPFKRLPIQLGAVLRNLGVQLKERDVDFDQRPSRLQLGGKVGYVVPPTLARNARAELSVDLVDELRFKRPMPRIGAEFTWDDAVVLRGGYLLERADTDAGGLSVGIGFVVRRLTIDFARTLSGLSADAGEPPAFLALRLTF